MRFADASAVAPDGDGRWRAEVQPNWDIFGVANGGYLMAMAARAMSLTADGRTPVSITSHFLRPVSAGPIEIDVETVKTGRTFSTVRAAVTSTALSMTLIGSFTTSSSFDVPPLYETVSPAEMPAPEDCVLAVPATDAPLPPPLLGNFELRVHPDDAGPLVGRPSGTARMRGWLRLPDEERLDVFALLLAADSFPPAVFNADLPLAWTPTLEMTTHIRAIPETGWLRCAFGTRLVAGGLLEEDGEIWDETGRLVVMSRQLGLVPR